MSLYGVDDNRVNGDVVSVCFDDEITREHHQIVEAFPWVNFYSSEPFSNGPYVARERLAASGTTSIILFQDSDDVPTLSRRQILMSQMLEWDADFIGSHELQVNELEQKVCSVRYPLDVTAALHTHPGHPLLLPTAAIRRDAIQAAGGFSTIRTFNSDLEFVLRAFMKIRNVDEFLYIRRIRAGSLTTAPETGIFSVERLALSAALRRDFVLIHNDDLLLEGSALTTSHRHDFAKIRIVRLR